MARTAPSIATETPGNNLTSALWLAQVTSLMQWIVGTGSNGVPRFLGYATTAQSISDSSSANTPVLLDSEAFDSDGGHSTTSNTSRYVCQVAGTYAVQGTLAYASNSVGARSLLIMVNSANVHGSAIQTVPVGSGFTTAMQVSALAQLNVGDYVELITWQSNGSTAINTNPSTKFGPALALWWISN